MEAGCHFGGARKRCGPTGRTLFVLYVRFADGSTPVLRLRSGQAVAERYLPGAKASPRQTIVGDIGGIDRREGKRSHSCAKAAHEWGTQIYERATLATSV